MKSEEDFNFQDQLQRVKVNFKPETFRSNSNRATTRSMVSQSIEWMEYDKAKLQTEGGTTPGSGTPSGSDGEQGENPLG